MAGQNVVFFGNEKLATGIDQPDLLILKAVKDAGFKVEQVVTGKLSELKPHDAQLAVLAAYGRIIPQSVLDQFPLGIINVHPSLLPLYRGPTPIEQTILDGASKTGVSIMRLTAGMDEGPIYKQKSLQISGKESKLELTMTLHQLGAELISEVLTDIATGSLSPRQQPHPDRATYSHKITKENGVLDFTKSATRLEREVRAYAQWPKSRTQIAGIDVIVTSACIADLHGEAGKIEIKDKALVIYCAEGALQIDKLKPAGKAEMTALAFLAGYGDRL